MPASNPAQPYQYLLLRVTPPVDALGLRQALQESLMHAFGLTASGGHVDVLWVDEATGKAAIRVDDGEDATRILASIVASSAAPRMQLIKGSSFLPSLLVDDAPL